MFNSFSSSSLTVSSLITSINHQQLCVVHLLLIVYNSIQTFNPNFRYVFRVLKLFSTHQLKQLFYQLFVRGLHKGRMGVLVFCCCSSNIRTVFFRQLCQFFFKLRSIITLKYLWILKHVTLLILLPTKMQPGLISWS